MAENTNQPYAFPFNWPTEMGNEYHPGMSLRDYFAAKAMQGMIQPGTLVHIDEYLNHFCETAYEVADAMLRAREKI